MPEPPEGDDPINNGAKTADRGAHGRFAPGNKASPGKPKGARHRASQMLDALTFKSVRGIAETLVAKANAGEPWAVTLVLRNMLPARSRIVSSPIDRQPVASVEEAASRIADIVARMEAGSLDLDEGASLVAALQGYMGARSIAELEREAVEMRQQIAELQAVVAQMTGRAR
jgi:hypothetical protein